MKKILKLAVLVCMISCLTACGNDGGTSDKSVTTTTLGTLITTTVPVDTEVIVTGTTINGYVPVVTTTGESGYVSSTSLTQETTSKVTTTTKGNETTTTTSKVNSTTKATTTQKPATVTTTTTKKTTTKATTTTKKVTTTTTTTKKQTTTTAQYKDIGTRGAYGEVASSGGSYYYGPSEDSGYYMKAYAGSSVYILGEIGEWYKAEKINEIVYIKKSEVINVEVLHELPYYDNDSALKMCELVNDLRAEWGRDELEVNEALMEAANVRAKELSESFSHTRPNGTGGTSVIREYLTGTWYRGENIGVSGTADYVYMFELFEGSEGHMGTMISSEYTMIGIGCYISDEGTMYCCQLFVGPRT